jgi:hypothetical protein
MSLPPSKIALVQVSSGASCNALLLSTERRMVCATLRREIDCLILFLRAQYRVLQKLSSCYRAGLISDALPFGRLWYGEPDAIGHAKFRSRSHAAVIGEVEH